MRAFAPIYALTRMRSSGRGTVTRSDPQSRAGTQDMRKFSLWRSEPFLHLGILVRGLTCEDSRSCAIGYPKSSRVRLAGENLDSQHDDCQARRLSRATGQILTAQENGDRRFITFSPEVIDEGTPN